MLSDAVAFWKAIEPKIESKVNEMMANAVRQERYEVVTPPDGKLIEVKQPFGKPIKLPYASTVADSNTGDTVIVEWRGTLSTALVVTFGDGKVRSGDIMADTITGQIISTNCVSEYQHNVNCQIKRTNLVSATNLECKDSGSVQLPLLTEEGFYSTELFNAVGSTTGFIPGYTTSFNYFDSEGNIVITINRENVYISAEMISRIADGKFYYNLAEHASISATFSANLVKGPNKGYPVPYIPNLTSVNINRYGKNIFTWEAIQPNFGTTIPNLHNLLNLLPVCKIAFSYDATLLDNAPVNPTDFGGLIFFNKNAEIRKQNTWLDNLPGSTKHFSGVLDILQDYVGKFTDISFYGIGRWDIGNTHPVKVSNFQIEISNMPTKFEPLTKANYTPASDGTVNGITSQAPTMNIISDTTGIYMEATYLANSSSYYKGKLELVNSEIERAVTYDALDEALSRGVNSI